MDVDSNIPHVSDSSSKSPSPEARLPPVLQYIQDWTPRMAAALAALPDREDVSRRDKFVSGMEWEFWQVSAKIGMAMALNLTFEIPELVKQLSEMFLIVPPDRITFLDRLHDAVISNPRSSEILKTGLVDAWWLDLSSASFPEYSYSGHQDRQRRLIERLDVLRRMTQRALDLNTRHVSSRASEVVQLTEAAESIRQMTCRSLQVELEADIEAASGAEAPAGADIMA